MMVDRRPSSWAERVVRDRFVRTTIWAALVLRRQRACIHRLIAAWQEVMQDVDWYTDEDGGFTEAIVMSLMVVSDLDQVLWLVYVSQFVAKALAANSECGGLFIFQ